jgi:hypothetical protein
MTGDQGSATFPIIEFSDIVKSFSCQIGRTNYTDPVGAGSASIVINNDNNEAKRFDLGTGIEIAVNGFLLSYFYVDSITYEDQRGLKGGATATLQCTGIIGFLGRIKVTSKAIAATSTYQQLESFNSAYYSGSGPLGYNLAFQRLPGPSFYGVAQGAQTYTGTILQYLQTTQATENNLVSVAGSYIWFPSFIDHASYFPSTTEVTFDRTKSASTIAYESIERNYLDSELANRVTVTPAGLSGQTASASSSVTTYGSREYSRGTYDFATSTALSNATWLANVMSDRAVQIFTISFTYEAQDVDALALFTGTIAGGTKMGFKLSYRPAGSLITQYEWCFIANAQWDSTPEKTVCTLTLHPANMYMPQLSGYGGGDSYAVIGTSRYNLLPTPSGLSSDWVGNKFTLASADPPFTFNSPTSVKGTVNTGTAGQSILIGDQTELNGHMVVKPSTAYTFSAYVYTPTTNTANTVWRVVTLGKTIAGVDTTATASANTTLTRGSWTRLSFTYTTTATTVRMAIYVESMSTLAVGQVVYVDDCLLEEGSVLDEYFDGTTRPAEGNVLNKNYWRLGRTV